MEVMLDMMLLHMIDGRGFKRRLVEIVMGSCLSCKSWDVKDMIMGLPRFCY